MEKSYPKFSFDGLVFVAQVVKVYDGDTIKVIFNPFPLDPKSKMWKFRIRLLDIDTNEMRPKKKDYPDEDERQEIIKLAKLARNDLAKKIYDKEITLVCGNFDVFGRILGHISIGELDVNDYMKKHNKNLNK
jgi:endonuclease YncB( thermonuclease family)